MTTIHFLFESDAKGGYVDVLADSALVPGAIVSQNAGSSNLGIYYQVGGGGLNGAFARALGAQVSGVNGDLQAAYDGKFGAGRWTIDSQHPPSPPPLTSFLVPVTPSAAVGKDCIAMMYSVGPVLTAAGLTSTEMPIYTQIYADAMAEIARHNAQNNTKIEGFRVTLLSSGIYRGGAPLAPFADAAAGCIIDAVSAAVKAQPAALGQVAILINSDRNAQFPKELRGFTNAATARGATVDASGFSISVIRKIGR